MILTFQVTEDYYNKCGKLFDSIKLHYKGRVMVGCIDFTPEDCPFETYYIDRSKCLYHNYECGNRKGFITLQHGEFVNFMPETDEPICNIDADVLIQSELPELTPEIGEILVTPISPDTLDQVIRRKAFGSDVERLEELYDTSRKEFSSGFMVANYSDWKAFFKRFKKNFKNIGLIKHHAGGMFMINVTAYQKLRVVFLDEIFHCAPWFRGSESYFDDGWLMVGDKKVKVIHTQFDDRYRYV